MPSLPAARGRPAGSGAGSPPGRRAPPARPSRLGRAPARRLRDETALPVRRLRLGRAPVRRLRDETALPVRRLRLGWAPVRRLRGEPAPPVRSSRRAPVRRLRGESALPVRPSRRAPGRPLATVPRAGRPVPRRARSEAGVPAAGPRASVAAGAPSPPGRWASGGAAARAAEPAPVRARPVRLRRGAPVRDLHRVPRPRVPRRVAPPRPDRRPRLRPASRRSGLPPLRLRPRRREPPWPPSPGAAAPASAGGEGTAPGAVRPACRPGAGAASARKDCRREDRDCALSRCAVRTVGPRSPR